ncbi:hypothetical protein PQX77_019930 [Marasmius sp. AFHP31]|nr:hypothetical protein PQX77_019930 [Marasmius sp. AFHP31]
MPECPTGLGLLLEHASRWGELVLDYEEEAYIQPPFWFIIRQLGRMPQLRSLSIKCQNEPGLAWMELLKSISESLPKEAMSRIKLSSLSLDGLVGFGYSPSDYFSSAFLSSHITSLDINVTPEITLLMLEACPKVVTARLALPLSIRVHESVREYQPRVHPHLRDMTLEIYGLDHGAGGDVEEPFFPHDVFCLILDRATCPALVSLSLLANRDLPMLPRGDERADDNVTNNLPFLPASIETFLIRSGVSESLWSFTLNNLPIADDKLKYLLEAMPNIRELTLGNPVRDPGSTLKLVTVVDSHILKWISDPSRLQCLQHIHLIVHSDLCISASVSLRMKVSNGRLASILLEFIDNSPGESSIGVYAALQEQGVAIRVRVMQHDGWEVFGHSGVVAPPTFRCECTFR